MKSIIDSPIFQEYDGDNPFIKRFISISNEELDMVYYGFDEDDNHNFIFLHDFQINRPQAGVKLKEISSNEIELYLIAVNDQIRNKGLGTIIMNYLIESSNETGHSILITPSNIYQADFGDKIGQLGISKKDKIKVSKLPKWYSKFGFKTYGKDIENKKRMKYTPQYQQPIP